MVFAGCKLSSLVVLLTLLRVTNGATAIMLVKLGETVDINFGGSVRSVQTEKGLVKNGKLTTFARQKFGNRIEWRNGRMKIKKIKSSDLSTFLYRLDGKPMALSLEEEL
uniref:GH97_N domain-containing protein n=1 Tax=Elaeophora elaphi TaxID=1147741 RepID=A0A0R3RZ43_9BILA